MHKICIWDTDNDTKDVKQLTSRTNKCLQRICQTRQNIQQCTVEETSDTAANKKMELVWSDTEKWQEHRQIGATVNIARPQKKEWLIDWLIE